MKYTFWGRDDTIVCIENDDVLITDAQSALDLMMTVIYEKDCNKIILDKKLICEDFFILNNGICRRSSTKIC